MTPADFKSWFAIFNEAIDGVPTLKQWHSIKRKIDDMNDGKEREPIKARTISNYFNTPDPKPTPMTGT